MRYHIAELNDSFPPRIDGVAQTVKNYALVLQKKYCDVTVVTPHDVNEQDGDYPFSVYRYSSVRLGEQIGYRMGIPFSPSTLLDLRRRHFDLVHVHAPFASSVLASELVLRRETPVVLTYHTKFDVDIQTRLASHAMQQVATKFVLHNVRQADEVWVVTKASEESLRAIGFEGACRVMENGTDFAFGQASEDAVAALRAQNDIPDDCFVFLFVGRMMWYKNLRLTLDALRRVKERGVNFRMLMVGDGFDLPDIKRYAEETGLADRVICPGPLLDRDQLRVYYTMADLFLFPSTYDTSGIVVKEAAACSCPSLLVRDSCAAEGAVDLQNAFLADEHADACAEAILAACADDARRKAVGKRAGETLYLSWESAVDRAYKRYTELIEGKK